MTNSFWVLWFRRCSVSSTRVAIPPPLLFGSGYVFDRASGTVSVTRSISRIPISRFELRLRDTQYVDVTQRHYSSDAGPGSFEVVEMTTRNPGRVFPVVHVFYGWCYSRRAAEIASGIRPWRESLNPQASPFLPSALAADGRTLQARKDAAFAEPAWLQHGRKTPNSPGDAPFRVGLSIVTGHLPSSKTRPSPSRRDWA